MPSMLSFWNRTTNPGNSSVLYPPRLSDVVDSSFSTDESTFIHHKPQYLSPYGMSDGEKAIIVSCTRKCLSRIKECKTTRGFHNMELTSILLQTNSLPKSHILKLGIVHINAKQGNNVARPFWYSFPFSSKYRLISRTYSSFILLHSKSRKHTGIQQPFPWRCSSRYNDEE